MSTKKHTISVRLDPAAARRVAAAARLAHQSRGAFLGQAGEGAARRTLLADAVQRYRQEEASLSELAAETGLAVEEIADAVGSQDRDASLALFLASCRTAAETLQDPEFVRLAEEAVRAVRLAGGVASQEDS